MTEPDLIRRPALIDRQAEDPKGINHDQLGVVTADADARVGQAVDQTGLTAGEHQGQFDGVDMHPQVAHGIGDRCTDVRRIAQDVTEHARGVEGVLRAEVQAEMVITGDLGGEIQERAILLERDTALDPELVAAQAQLGRDASLGPSGVPKDPHDRRHPQRAHHRAGRHGSLVAAFLAASVRTLAWNVKHERRRRAISGTRGQSSRRVWCPPATRNVAAAPQWAIVRGNLT